AAETTAGLRVAVWVGPTTLELLDEAGKVVCRAEMPNATQREGIVISRDGTRLASIWEDGTWNRLAVYDATTGEQLAVCDGHRDFIFDLTFNPNGTQPASASRDETACVWDATTGALKAKFKGHKGSVASVAYHPRSECLVTASSDGTVRQWDSQTAREIAPPFDQHHGSVGSAVYSPDGEYIASAG
ncbi:MAG: hypothetical protein KDA84_28205, partial [Planctomycetaceae bacterium]|nr:hypothetical protein [Planctomycetaceae bacterium]